MRAFFDVFFVAATTTRDALHLQSTESSSECAPSTRNKQIINVTTTHGGVARDKHRVIKAEPRDGRVWQRRRDRAAAERGEENTVIRQKADY